MCVLMADFEQYLATIKKTKDDLKMILESKRSAA